MPDVAGDMRTWQPANAELLGRVLAGLRALPVMRDAARQRDDPVLREQLDLLRVLWGTWVSHLARHGRMVFLPP